MKRRSYLTEQEQKELDENADKSLSCCMLILVGVILFIMFSVFFFKALQSKVVSDTIMNFLLSAFFGFVLIGYKKAVDKFTSAYQNRLDETREAHKDDPSE